MKNLRSHRETALFIFLYIWFRFKTDICRLYRSRLLVICIKKYGEKSSNFEHLKSNGAHLHSLTFAPISILVPNLHQLGNLACPILSRFWHFLQQLYYHLQSNVSTLFVLTFTHIADNNICMNHAMRSSDLWSRQCLVACLISPKSVYPVQSLNYIANALFLFRNHLVIVAAIRFKPTVENWYFHMRFESSDNFPLLSWCFFSWSGFLMAVWIVFAFTQKMKSRWIFLFQIFMGPRQRRLRSADSCAVFEDGYLQLFAFDFSTS